MSKAVGFLKRRAVVCSIMMLIAAVHILRLGSYLQGELFNLYYSYFSDIAIPFGCYFLLYAPEVPKPVFGHWEAKSAIVFVVPSIAETLQYFGVPVLGSTFDPLDYAMYAVGAISAALVDRQVFSRVFGFWITGSAER